MRKNTFYRQLNAMDCGPTCLRMVAKYYGKHFNASTLRHYSDYSKLGVSLLGLSDTAEKLGLRTRGVKIDFDQLRETPLPCILHWDQNHFVVLLKISASKVKVADPAKGIIMYTISEFIGHWTNIKGNTYEKGVALLLEPTTKFYETIDEKEQKQNWRTFFIYLKTSKWQVWQIFIAFLLTSCIQLIFPFLTQSVVDKGIAYQDLNFLTVILLAQLMLNISLTFTEFVRSRLVLRVSNLLNFQILSDFWIKLTKLPVAYFDVHHAGDTLQRIGDHKTIQAFITGTAINTFFSTFNFIIYAIILVIYDVKLFLIFFLSSLLYFAWIQFFLKARRKINYETFHLSSKENTATLQFIQGMQEIRLNNAETQKRWEWENIQASLLKLNVKSLNFSQFQQAGATLITQIHTFVISFIVAKSVIENKLTLGAMLAIQFIMAQLFGPIQQWMAFVQSGQDAKIGLERLNEIHQLNEEENPQNSSIRDIGHARDIRIKQLSFTYPGAGNEKVLNNINLHIPQNNVIAIVGTSGSGKTTLIKLLLKIYDHYSGSIQIGSDDKVIVSNNTFDFAQVSHSYWRGLCGCVLQDGYIFNDSIAKNIDVSGGEMNFERLIQSCKIANIYSFIESLPNGFNTNLGSEGMGISQGQKQRILIARAVYKNPEYIFFDEATNALDANNEMEIVANLSRFFKGRTVIIVAHRLSTVKHADKIIVLESGTIAEEGTHAYLTSIKGKYYQLVKNQLELGN